MKDKPVGLYWKIRADMKSAPVYTPGEFTITLDKRVFEEDCINYEYKHEDGIYTLVESTPEEKERKRNEYKNRTDTDAREQDTN